MYTSISEKQYLKFVLGCGTYLFSKEMEQPNSCIPRYTEIECSSYLRLGRRSTPAITFKLNKLIVYTYCSSHLGGIIASLWTIDSLENFQNFC